MNILLLYKENFSGTYGPFVHYFPKKGNKLVWVQGIDKQDFKKYKNIKIYNIKHKNKVEGFFLYRIPINAINNVSYILRKIFSFSKTKDLVNKESIDIIVSVDRILDIVLGYLISKFQKIPFIYRFDFPLYESIIYQFKKGRRLWIFKVPFAKLAILLRNYFIKKADLVLPISNEIKGYVLSLGINPSKVEIVHSGAIIPNVQKNIYKKYDLVYLGTQAENRKLDFLIKVLQHLNEKIQNVKLVMIGDINKKLERIVKGKKLEDNVKFAGYVSNLKLAKLLQQSKLGLCPQPTEDFFKTMSPLKFVEYLACGLPVVATDIPEQKEVIKKHKCGICVPHDERKFADAIIYLLNHPKKAEQMGIRGQKFVREHRTFDVLGKKIEKRFLQLPTKS